MTGGTKLRAGAGKQTPFRLNEMKYVHLFYSRKLRPKEGERPLIFVALGDRSAEMDAKGRLISAHQGGRLMIKKPIDGKPATMANGGTIVIAAASQADSHHGLNAPTENIAVV